MSQIYRISQGLYFAEIVDSVEEVEEFARQNGHGRYHVDEISADQFRSGHTSRRWGIVFAKPDGTVDIDRDPWPV
jgi:hypothetical protein